MGYHYNYSGCSAQERHDEYSWQVSGHLEGSCAGAINNLSTEKLTVSNDESFARTQHSRCYGVYLRHQVAPRKRNALAMAGMEDEKTHSGIRKLGKPVFPNNCSRAVFLLSATKVDGTLRECRFGCFLMVCIARARWAGAISHHS